MKKSLFFFVAAACVALCNISCGSDDDGGSNNNNENNAQVTLPLPKYSAQAAAYTIPANAVKSADGDASLTGMNFTESGKAVIEVTTGGTKKYVTYSVKIEGDTYIITNGSKQVGVVQADAPTRGSSDITVAFELEVEITDLGSFFFKTDGTTARKLVETIASSANTDNIARTWAVQEMKLTLEGDVSASLNEKSGNLKVLADEAQARGADLTPVELEELDKTIKGLTLDKNGLFSIEYNDETEACSWKWTDANQTKLMLQLRDSDFGNKFFSNNSSIDVKFFNSGVCHFILVTNVNTGSKKYTATLLVVMM
jgi:hypothetical protein